MKKAADRMELSLFAIGKIVLVNVSLSTLDTNCHNTFELTPAKSQIVVMYVFFVYTFVLSTLSSF